MGGAHADPPPGRLTTSATTPATDGGNRAAPRTDGVVTLRRFTLDDVDDVHAACQDPEIARWTTTIPWPYPKEAARSWIASHTELWAQGEHAPFAIIANDDGRLLGSVSVHVKRDRDQAVFGYWVAAPERRTGVASRALRLAVSWARSYAGVAELTLRTKVGNVASEGVARAAGFEVVAEETDFRPAGAPGQRLHVKLWSQPTDAADRASTGRTPRSDP